ncbi:MAG TPA: diguanylate cyclase, partial [Kineosporiaceae bacterium]|nr:diguanylate cyclase [Kineosporiaceae bacterium]
PVFPCRLGGDEFAVLLPGAAQGQALEHARAVSTLLHDRYEVSGGTVPLGATIGVATHVWPAAGTTATPDADGAAPAGDPAQALSALLAAADQAMYHARLRSCRIGTATGPAAVDTSTRRRPVA